MIFGRIGRAGDIVKYLCSWAGTREELVKDLVGYYRQYRGSMRSISARKVFLEALLVLQHLVEETLSHPTFIATMMAIPQGFEIDMYLRQMRGIIKEFDNPPKEEHFLFLVSEFITSTIYVFNHIFWRGLPLFFPQKRLTFRDLPEEVKRLPTLEVSIKYVPKNIRKELGINQYVWRYAPGILCPLVIVKSRKRIGKRTPRHFDPRTCVYVLEEFPEVYFLSGKEPWCSFLSAEDLINPLIFFQPEAWRRYIKDVIGGRSPRKEER